MDAKLFNVFEEKFSLITRMSCGIRNNNRMNLRVKHMIQSTKETYVQFKQEIGTPSLLIYRFDTMSIFCNCGR